MKCPLPLKTLSMLLIALTTLAGVLGAVTPLDDWPTGWVTAAHGNTLVEKEALGEEGMQVEYLKITRSGSGVGAITFWDAGGRMSDYSGSVVMRHVFSTHSRVQDPYGVLIGAENQTYNNSATTNHRGYYIGVKPGSSDGDGGLGIWFNSVITTTNYSADTVVDPGAYASFDFLPANIDYLLEFSVMGPSILASLWTLDGEGQKIVSVADVSYTASEDIEGFFGLMGGRYSGNDTRYFRDLNMTMIPEPSVVGALMGAFLIGGVLLFRRR